MSQINLIGISGYIGSGKDTVGKIIQELTRTPIESYVTIEKGVMKPMMGGSEWKIKKFADKLKQIAEILTGIPKEKFEDQEFKKSYLPSNWSTIVPEPGKREDGFWGTGKLTTKATTVRGFLQQLGTNAMRDNLHENVWVNALFSNYLPYKKPGNYPVFDSNLMDEMMDYAGIERELVYPNWLITDCRFPNEADAIKLRGGIIIRVHRSENTDVLLNPKHPSETALDNYLFDYTIENNSSLEELTDKVKQMLQHYNILT